MFYSQIREKRAGVLCLQNHFVSVLIICEAIRFAFIDFKFNIRQEGSWVLGRSPDTCMAIR